MVPDVTHALVKGNGVFISPVTPQSKAKLRLLFECAAIALIVEAAGGAAATHDCKRVLDVNIDHTNVRCGFIAGSKNEVQRYVDQFQQS